MGLLIALAFMINAYGISGIIPIKGIAIHFLSYGGSSMLATSIRIGMVLMISKKASDGDRQSTDLQRDALISAGVDERNIFEDKASGAKDDRVGLTQALEYVKEGDVLVVWKLDRLGRSLPHLIEIISNLKSKGVGFKSLTEGMDTFSPSGELLFHVFGALAQFERSLIQERVNAGLAAAKKRGRVGGRPKAIPQEKMDVILEALNNGMSKAAVCRTFNVKRSTLIDTLKRIQ